MRIAEAKLRLTIPALWEYFGFRGKPRKSCRCPWRLDRHPSFSVFANGTRWKDHGTGESGDAVDFYQMAAGISQVDACRKFTQLASVGLPVSFVTKTPKAPAVLPVLVSGTETNCRLLSDHRHVSIVALDLAIQRGLLRFGIYRGYSAWFVTDASRRAIQARRLDGGRWWNNGPKALNISGTTPSWPVGTACIGPYSHVIVVEGGPDLLAAFHFLILAGTTNQVTAVSILGASNTIHADAVPLFAHKRVRIVPHRDQVGANAGLRWKRQIEASGATVDIVGVEALAPMVAKAKDLNDLCLVPDGYRVASALIAGFL